MQKIERPKFRNTGPLKNTDFVKLQVMLRENDFVKYVEFTSPAPNVIKPRIFAGNDAHLAMVKQFCSASKPSAVLEIDMTYKCGNFYVTVFALPLFVWSSTSGESEKHPAIVVAIGISYKKEFDDYMFFSDKLKSYCKIETLVYGTDGEPAREDAMESNFPIEDTPPSKSSIHLRCFQHVRNDIPNFLQKTMPSNDANEICNQILG